MAWSLEPVCLENAGLDPTLTSMNPSNYILEALRTVVSVTSDQKVSGNRNRLTDIENRFMVTKREWGGIN